MIHFDPIKKAWDDGREVLSKNGASGFKLEMKNTSRRGVNVITVEISGFDSIQSDKVQNAKRDTLEWLKKFGAVKQVSRGVLGLFAVEIEGNNG